MKRKLIWLDQEIDQKAIQVIRQRYGCESDSAAIRLALRVLASSPHLEIRQESQQAEGKRENER